MAAGNHTEKLSPVAMSNGTQVILSSIYFNTPARRKFLKSAATEFGHCDEVFKRLALSNEKIFFSLSHNGKEKWNLNPQTKNGRISNIVRDFEESRGILIDVNNPHACLFGLVNYPTHTNTSRDKQYFFVNGRFIRSSVLSHAIKQAYRDVIHHISNPSYV